MNTEHSPVGLTEYEIEYFKTLNEFDSRRFLSCKVTHPNGDKIRPLCKLLKISKDTVYRGIKEIREHISPGKGRIRKPGGGAKRKISKHPEWVTAFDILKNEHLAGLPQDENTKWLDISVSQIRQILLDCGFDISVYIIKHLIQKAGLKRRSFSMSLVIGGITSFLHQYCLKLFFSITKL